MKIAIVYVGIAAIGYLIAAFLTSKKNSFTWIGKALSIIVTCLIFLMGFRIGENEEVVGNIGTIGLQTLIMALVSLAIAILAMTGVRRLIGYDKYAMVKGDKSSEEKDEQKTEKSKGRFFSKSTIRYLIAVIVGFILGYILVIKTEALSFEMASSVTAILVTYGLYAMVFLVGLDMGFGGSFVKVFKSAGLRALAIPVTTALATLASHVHYVLLRRSGGQRDGLYRLHLRLVFPGTEYYHGSRHDHRRSLCLSGEFLPRYDMLHDHSMGSQHLRLCGDHTASSGGFYGLAHRDH